ncbi:SusE domain-containing protein [Arcticibacter tournemirensis]
MKNLLGFLTILCIVLVSGCKEENDAVVTISDVTVVSPEEGTSINIDPKSNAVVTFEWSVKASDGVLLFQELLFDKEDGDFSNPIYRITPGKNGVEKRLTVTHKELNKIAYYAGIGELSTGKIKWKVVSTTGVVSANPDAYSIITVKRPVGVALNPESVLLYGEATDAGGDDISKAVSFKKLSDGVFEAYTALKPGSYKMAGKIGDQTIMFKLDGTTITAGASGTSPAATPAVYRIKLDFNESVASLTEIQSVGLWFCAYNSVKMNLVYQGYGVWKISDTPVVFKQESWGKDNRYNFRVVEKNAEGQTATFAWGSSKKDNNAPSGSTEASYFYLKPISINQWDYSYKFEREVAAADIEVKFHASGDYTHKITYK